jgi:uncharacterized membrane protein
MVLFAAVLIGWPLIRLTDRIGDRPDPYTAVRMLHQVASFQMELVSSNLRTAAAAANTSQLELLQQSVYAAQYAHQRLRLAVNGELAELEGLDLLMQVIFHLGIGGDRTLTAAERSLFSEAAPMMQDMHEAYRELLSGDARIIGSRNDALREADRRMAGFFQRKLLD